MIMDLDNSLSMYVFCQMPALFELLDQRLEICATLGHAYLLDDFGP